MKGAALGLGFSPKYGNILPAPLPVYASLASKAVAIASFERLIPGSGPLATIYRYVDGQSTDVYSASDIDSFLAGTYGRVTNWYDQKTGEALTFTGGASDKILVKAKGRWGISVQSNGATEISWSCSDGVNPTPLALALSGVASIQASFIDLNGGEDTWSGSASPLLISTGDSTTNARVNIFKAGTSSIATLSYGGRRADATTTTTRVGLTNVIDDQILVGSWDSYNSTIRVWRNGGTVELNQTAQFGAVGTNFAATPPLKVATKASCSGAIITERCIFVNLTDAEMQIIRDRQAAYKIEPAVTTLYSGAWTSPSSPNFIYSGGYYTVGQVNAQGYQRLYQFDGNGVISSALTLSVAYAGRDDHNAPAIIMTPGGVLGAVWAGHNAAGTFHYSRSTSASPKDFLLANAKTVSGLPGTSSYAEVFTNGTDVYGSCRQQILSPSAKNQWWLFKSTDDMVTFDTGKALIETVDQFYIWYYPMGGGIVRFISYKNSDSVTQQLKIGYIDLATETVYSGGASVGSYASAPVTWESLTGIVVYAGQKIAPNGFNGSLVTYEVIDATSAVHMAAHFNGGDFGLAANWSLKTVANHGPVMGFYNVTGRATVSGNSSLSYPRIAAVSNDGSTCWLKQYDYDGTNWSETGTLRSISMVGANMICKPFACKSPPSGGYEFGAMIGTFREYGEYQTDNEIYKGLDARPLYMGPEALTFGTETLTFGG